MLVNPAIAYENFEFIGKRSLIKKVIIRNIKIASPIRYISEFTLIYDSANSRA